jgi:hypothetical protein
VRTVFAFKGGWVRSSAAPLIRSAASSGGPNRGGFVKRVLVAIGLVAALTLSGASASADAVRSVDVAEGTKRGGPVPIRVVRLVAVTRDQVPVAVKRFRFRGLLARCAGGNRVRVKGKISRMGVNNGHFGRTIRRAGRKVHVEGNFRRGGTVVRGKIRARGRFRRQRNCDSGVVRWRAS